MDTSLININHNSFTVCGSIDQKIHVLEIQIQNYQNNRLVFLFLHFDFNTHYLQINHQFQFYQYEPQISYARFLN